MPLGFRNIQQEFGFGWCGSATREMGNRKSARFDLGFQDNDWDWSWEVEVWYFDLQNQKINQASTKNTMQCSKRSFRISPEDLLLKGIHSANQNLQQRLITLKEQGTQLGAGATFEGFIEYLQTFEQSLGQAESLYAIQEEVLCLSSKHVSSWATFLHLLNFMI